MKEIANGIFYEDSFLGVTVGALVHSFGIVMIDVPLRPEEARLWRSMLLNQRGGPNRLLIYLDAHPDRTLGARIMDSLIIAHQKTAQAYRSRPAVFRGQMAPSGSDWETFPDSVGMRWSSPDLNFTKSMTIHWGPGEAVLEHRPGPMPGSIWVVIPWAKVVFVGDLVTVNQPPFLSHANLEEWIENLDVLLTDYRDFTIVSGRGGIATVKDVRFQKSILTKTLQGFENLARKGAPPQATENLVASLLKKYEFPPESGEIYEMRLRSGMMQCYMRMTRVLASQGSDNLSEKPQTLSS